MTEQEEFEFRLRLEKERSEAAPSVDTPKAKDKPTFAQLFKEEALSSMPAELLGVREYLSGTPQGVAAAAPTRFAVGAAEPIQGAVQRMSENKGLRQTFPLMSLAATVSRPMLDESFAATKRMAKEGGAEGYDVAGLLGRIASPASLGVSKVPIPSSLLGQTALGATAGGIGGMLAPADTEEQARQNALMGVVLGGGSVPVIRGVAAVLDAGKNYLFRPIADLFTKEGPMNIARRYVQGSKGVGEQNMPVVLNATRNAQDILPGGKPTVADTLAGVHEGSPVNALQEIVSKTAGGQSAAFGKRIEEQAAAIKAAEIARTAASTSNYGKAFDTALHKVTPDAELKQMAQSPYFEQVLPAVERVAKHKGLTWEDNLTEMLHNVKIGLDKKLNPGFGEVAIDNAERGAVLDLKKQLVAWLAKKNSDYEAGRVAHEKASKLIDAYKLRQELVAKPTQSTNLGGGINIAEETRPHLPQMLSRPAMILNAALRTAGKNVEPKVDNALREILLDPQKFTSEMSKLSPKARTDVEKILRVYNSLATGTAMEQ